MRTLYFSLSVILLLLTVLWVPDGRAQERTLVEIRDLTPREAVMEGFVLDSRQTLRVEAIGAESQDRDRHFWNDRGRRDAPDYWPGIAWILNARTREVVWTLRNTDTRNQRNGVHTFDGAVTLPAGVYEAYYASYAGTGITFSGNWDRYEKLADNINDAINNTFNREERRRAERNRDRHITYQGEFVDNRVYEDFKLIIRGTGQTAGRDVLERERAAFKETAFISMSGLGDESYEQAGFILTAPTDIEIYAFGEARGDESYDYGWILNADTREKIWVLDAQHSNHAGGSEKNRMVRTTRSLPAGRYAAFFVTDDSHSADEWNAVPAYDPAFWGLTLRVNRPADLARVERFNYEFLPEKNAIIALTGVRNGEMASKGFTLKRDLDVRIYALGEGRDRDMFDYGWIVDAKTRQRVWEMRYANTDHAGGAQKNRVFDDVVSLPAGDYLAYYITDDSHAYGNWNSAPPIGGEHWGLTVLPASGTLDRSLVSIYDERQDPNVLAQIIQVRDDRYERQRFTLNRSTRVRVYALGEGDDDMVDYGWIENARTGRAVWEMTYRTTDHAGGARKNRMTDTTLLLDAGEYVLYYKTDDSHAFGDWNSTPPADPLHWGITVYRATDR